MKTAVLLILLILEAVALSACRSMTDALAAHHSGATVHFARGDSDELIIGAEADFKRELAGYRPSGNTGSWELYWQRRYYALALYSKDADKIIPYIRRRRKELSLPDYWAPLPATPLTPTPSKGSIPNGT
jgi:hypothetical protein